MYNDTRHFIGVCENNVDPEKRARIQVRIIGVHDNFSVSDSVPDFNSGHGLPTKDLPWASCCFPATYGGTSASTLPAPQIQPGAFVFGVSLDGDFYNQLIVLGVLPTLYNVDALSKNVFEGTTAGIGQGNGGGSGNKPEVVQGDIPFNDWLEAIGWCESGCNPSHTQMRSDKSGKISKRRGYWCLSRGEAIKVIGHSKDYDDIADSIELAATPVPDTNNKKGVSPLGDDCARGGHGKAYITSHFGVYRGYEYKPDGTMNNTARYWHGGVDLQARTSDNTSSTTNGCTIQSVLSGRVVASSPRWGTVIIESNLKCSDGTVKTVQLYYLHLRERNVNIGDVVGCGQAIGTAGGIGKSGTHAYPVHLHFECRVNVNGAFKIANPEEFLRQCDVSLIDAGTSKGGDSSGIKAQSEANYYRGLSKSLAWMDNVTSDVPDENVPESVVQEDYTKLEKVIAKNVPNVKPELFAMCHIAVSQNMVVPESDGDLGYLGSEQKYLEQYEYINTLLLNKKFSQIIITCLMSDYHKESGGDPIYMSLRYAEGMPLTVKRIFRKLYNADTYPDNVRYADLIQALGTVCKNPMNKYFRKAFGYVYQQCDSEGTSGKGVEIAERGSDGKSEPYGRVKISSYGVK